MSLRTIIQFATVLFSIAIGILLVSLNWKNATSNLVKKTSKQTPQNEFSESQYQLAVSDDIAEMGFSIETDFPINVSLSKDSLQILIEHSINSGLASAAAFYNEIIAEKENKDSFYLQSARYLVVANQFTKDESRGNIFLLKALNLLEKILKNNPKNTDAKTLKGYVLVRTQPMTMEGIAILQEVLQDDPNNTDALFMMGDFSIESGQYEKALERFKKLLSLQPFNSDYNFKVSEVFSRLNMKDSADYYLKRGTEFRTKETIKGQ